MEKINYQNQLMNLIESFHGQKPTLFLHSCCGPCSSEVIDFLKDYFIITVYYYNPNIEPKEEYEKRKREQIRFLKEYQMKTGTLIDFLDCDYENTLYENLVGSITQEKEGGSRCQSCYTLRLRKTALKGKSLGFDYFGTTLTVSPHKNSEVINKIGEEIAKDVGLPFIYGDFKKNNGYQKSILKAKEYNLYRQNYCGCLYGKEHM